MSLNADILKLLDKNVLMSSNLLFPLVFFDKNLCFSSVGGINFLNENKEAVSTKSIEDLFKEASSSITVTESKNQDGIEPPCLLLTMSVN